MVCFIQVKTWTPFSSLNAGLPLASTKEPPVTEQQDGEIADNAFLLVPGPDDREFNNALLLDGLWPGRPALPRSREVH